MHPQSTYTSVERRARVEGKGPILRSRSKLVDKEGSQDIKKEDH